MGSLSVSTQLVALELRPERLSPPAACFTGNVVLCLTTVPQPWRGTDADAVEAAGNAAARSLAWTMLSFPLMAQMSKRLYILCTQQSSHAPAICDTVDRALIPTWQPWTDLTPACASDSTIEGSAQLIGGSQEKIEEWCDHHFENFMASTSYSGT